MHHHNGNDRGGHRHNGGGERGGPGGRDGDEQRHGGPGRDGRPDTRFLQLEMSQVLYSEAEAVARPAFRELLLEAAKLRIRERWGDRITALAELVVDELLDGALASLEIEGRIQERSNEGNRTQARLREIFGQSPEGPGRAGNGGTSDKRSAEPAAREPRPSSGKTPKKGR